MALSSLPYLPLAVHRCEKMRASQREERPQSTRIQKKIRVSEYGIDNLAYHSESMDEAAVKELLRPAKKHLVSVCLG